MSVGYRSVTTINCSFANNLENIILKLKDITLYNSGQGNIK